MSAAEKAAAYFHAVADHPALAMLADGRNRLNGTLEAVERVPCPGSDQLESLVVFITANFACRHLAPRLEPLTNPLLRDGWPRWTALSPTPLRVAHEPPLHCNGGPRRNEPSNNDAGFVGPSDVEG
jgi:hypothetical protein